MCSCVYVLILMYVHKGSLTDFATRAETRNWGPHRNPMSVLYEIITELKCNEIETVEQLEVSIAK